MTIRKISTERSGVDHEPRFVQMGLVILRRLT